MTEDHGLVFVDELPGKATGQAKTRKRAEALRAQPGKWARWPSKTAGSGLRKALGEGYEVEMRLGHAYVRFVGEEAGKAAASGPPPTSSGKALSCRYCGVEYAEAGDSDALITTRLKTHRRAKPACDRQYKRDGM